MPIVPHCPDHMPKLQLSPRSAFFNSQWIFPSGFFFSTICVFVHVCLGTQFLYILFHVAPQVGQPRKPKNVRLDRKGGKQREGEYPVCFLENPWLLPPFYEETFRMWATDEAHCAHIISRLHRPAIRMMEKGTQRAGLTWVHGESIADRSRGYILGPVLAVWIPIPSLVI